LVTGGAGFIGSNLVRALEGGHEVTVLDDFSAGDRGSVADTSATVVEGSVVDSPLVAELVGQADAVVHLAAMASVPDSIADPRRCHDVNVTGTLHVLEAARQRGTHVIFASSSAVYGPTGTMPVTESSPTRPISPYGASKLAAEAYTLAHQAAFALPALALRFFNVFGPGQSADHPYAAVVPSFLAAALCGRPLRIFGDGRQTRDLTYVADVVSVLVAAVEGRLCHPEPVNLATGRTTDLLSLIALLRELLRRDLETTHEAPRPGDIRHSGADVSRLCGLVGELTVTPLEQGLAETAAWLAARTGDTVAR
jgi:UDP-glucose 4-epimerase